MKRSYEPDRMTQTNLKEAYERLVPTSIRMVPVVIKRRQAEETYQTHREGEPG